MGRFASLPQRAMLEREDVMMSQHIVTQLLDLRVWRDERLGQIWRISYDEGDGEMMVAFPDTAALGDFIMERLGLRILDESGGEPLPYASYYLPDESYEAEIITRS